MDVKQHFNNNVGFLSLLGLGTNIFPCIETYFSGF